LTAQRAVFRPRCADEPSESPEGRLEVPYSRMVGNSYFGITSVLRVIQAQSRDTTKSLKVMWLSVTLPQVAGANKIKAFRRLGH